MLQRGETGICNTLFRSICNSSLKFDAITRTKDATMVDKMANWKQYSADEMPVNVSNGIKENEFEIVIENPHDLFRGN